MSNNKRGGERFINANLASAAIAMDDYTQASAWPRTAAIFLAIAGSATLLPLFLHIQWMTGPFVNAMLIIMLFLVGIRSALVLCMLPSLAALAGGLLPAPLAPVVPFIMIGNAIYILLIEFFYSRSKDQEKGYWYGVAAGSAGKFLFLYGSVTIIVRLVLKQELAVKVAQMMSWPQLATAATGGMLAWIFLKWIRRI